MFSALPLRLRGSIRRRGTNGVEPRLLLVAQRGVEVEVTIRCDGEIGDADWDLIGYREQNSAGPSAQPAEPTGNTFTVRVLSPDFLPEYTVAAVLYSKTPLAIKGVDVKSIKPN
jgi:hypothetical protein